MSISAIVNGIRAMTGRPKSRCDDHVPAVAGCAAHVKPAICGKTGRRGAVVACSVSAIMLLAACFADFLTGTEISFSLFYLVPILLTAWYTGIIGGVIACLIASVMWYVTDVVIGLHTYSGPLIGYWNAGVRLCFFLISSVSIVRLKHSREVLARRAAEISEAYEALDQTRREQLLVKDRIFSNVSHELRTPLTALHQFITLVSDGLAGPVTSQQAEYLSVALRNARQLDSMIKDLLDCVRTEGGSLRMEKSNVVAAHLVEEAIQSLRMRAVEANLTISSEVESNLPAVSADPIRLRQVLLNLLDNATKFTPPGGRIQVRVGRWARNAGYLHVSVSDTGKGISPEAREMLFRRMYQENRNDVHASRKGLGLGLFLSREIIKLHGGDIWAESKPGAGSCFHFVLPFGE